MKTGAGKNKTLRVKLPIGLLCFVCVFILYCFSSENRIRVFSGATMGTSYTVKIVYQSSGVQIPDSSAGNAIDSLLILINDMMSVHDPNSGISRFNDFNATDWFAVPAELVFVVEKSLQVSKESKGAFDITVSPLIDLWGFGKTGIHQSIPPAETIKKYSQLVGYQYLKARKQPPALRKHIPQLQCNLSAIAKGYGVDRIAAWLDNRGFTNYMVEIGGEISSRGTNLQGAPWRIGISEPDEMGQIHRVVELRDKAIATSGDYHNYFEKDGIRYSHTLDPRTGRPITHKLASVTVIDSSCMMADAYATAIDVLGPESGYEFARENSLPVYMLIRQEDGFKAEMTSLFSSTYLK
ncbi:FAD:protein FMN transferase ApbE [candidate division KSB1 bacterium]|nr:FAD:protein FMN transferase ApbE [candidate division KSB1 bacterium]